MPDKDRLVQTLEAAGPMATARLGERLGLPRTSLRRAVQAAGDRVLAVGRARAVRYAARREIKGFLPRIPIHEVDPTGDVRAAMTLHAVAPQGFWVEAHVDDVDEGFYEVDPRDPGPEPGLDLPWFLLDLKPAGFMARQWLAANAWRGWPASLAGWRDEHVLNHAVAPENDHPGAFVVGPWVRRADGSDHRIDAGAEVDELPRLAERALRGQTGSSSLGGDQPKFTVTLDGESPRPCIVKFSPPVEDPAGRRWADLLVTEHLVHELLRERGIDAARSRVVDAGGRRFLVVERFDRHGSVGRSGVATLHCLDRRGIAADLRRWSPVTAGLAAEGRLDAADHARVRWLESFGDAIANTDMHPGNLALRLRGTRILGLAPVYDMLPMAHAPRYGGELPSGLHRPMAEADEPSAAAAASELWARVEAEPRVSDSFRWTAEAQRKLLR